MSNSKQKILNCNHDFGFKDFPMEDNPKITKENLFCKNCGEHFLAIIKTYQEELSNPDKYHLTPVCQLCGAQNPIDGFVPACWLQIETEEPYNQHGDKIIWVCPDCIAKKANAN